MSHSVPAWRQRGREGGREGGEGGGDGEREGRREGAGKEGGREGGRDGDRKQKIEGWRQGVHQREERRGSDEDRVCEKPHPHIT